MKIYQVFYSINIGSRCLTKSEDGYNKHHIANFSTRDAAEQFLRDLIEYGESREKPVTYVHTYGQIATQRVNYMDITADVRELDIVIDSGGLETSLPGFKEILVKRDLKGLLE